jgi:16S rRNA (guanine966-N2)-methyltransferase
VSIRVIAGSAKGRQLKLVPGDTTRPVMDRVKEALFNIIGRDIFDATFLDLFAGTGSVGIEALSRGAKQAVFVEIERKAIQTIEDNLKLTKLNAKAVIRRGDAFSILKQPPTQPFDFIYIAPPQYKGLWEQVLAALDADPKWIGQYTSVIVQIDPSEASPLNLKHLELVDERRYGKTLLWFFAGIEEIPSDAPQEQST